MTINAEQVFMFSNFTGGVNRAIDDLFQPVKLKPEEMIQSQNMYWRNNGMRSRRGTSTYFNGTVILGGARIDNNLVSIHRRYFADGLNSVLYVADDQGIVYSRDNDDSFYLIKHVFATSGQLIFFEDNGVADETYVGNGVDAPIKLDPNSSAYAAAPTATAQFILHRNRVFSRGSGLIIRYSDNLDPDTWDVGNSITITTNDPKLTAMNVHSQSLSDKSVQSELVAFTANSTWMLSGTDFATGSNIVLEKISSSIGTLSPKTVTQTPFGTVFLGRGQGENNVYLIIGQGLQARIVPIGNNIKGIIDDIPTANLEAATGIYYDGFYRLFFQSATDTYNRQEWWLSFENMTKGVFAWYGPMIRFITRGIQDVALLSGALDNNELVAASSIVPGAEPFAQILNLNNSDANGDTLKNDSSTSTFQTILQTKYDDFQIPTRVKKFIDMYIKVQTDSERTLTCDVLSNFGLNSASKNIVTPVLSGFPYTFPLVFATPDPSIRVIPFKQSKIKGTDLSLQLKTDISTNSLFVDSIGATVRTENQNIKHRS